MTPIPLYAEDLVEELEAAYPPACKQEQESLEAHARYAGMVELVQNLRRRITWASDTDASNLATKILNKT
jgi:hypothetical protein